MTDKSVQVVSLKRLSPLTAGESGQMGAGKQEFASERAGKLSARTDGDKKWHCSSTLGCILTFTIVSYQVLYMNSWHRSLLAGDKVVNSTAGKTEVGNRFFEILGDKYFGFVFESAG